MAEKRKSLGRGLDALLGGSTQTHTSNTTKSLNELPIEEVGPGPFQPRKKIEKESQVLFKTLSGQPERWRTYQQEK